MLWFIAGTLAVLAFVVQGFFFTVWLRRGRGSKNVHEDKFLVRTRWVPGFSHFYVTFIPVIIVGWAVLFFHLAIQAHYAGCEEILTIIPLICA